MQAHPSWLLFFFLTTPRCPELPGLSSFTNSTLLSYIGTQTAPGKSYLTWKIKQKGRKLFCWKFLDTYICCQPVYRQHPGLTLAVNVNSTQQDDFSPRDVLCYRPAQVTVLPCRRTERESEVVPLRWLPLDWGVRREGTIRASGANAGSERIRAGHQHLQSSGAGGGGGAGGQARHL